MSTEAIPEAQFLRDFTVELHNNNAAVFAGAGLSMKAGYVDWHTLLRDIISDLGLDPDKEHDLITLAQYSVTKAGDNRARLTKAIVHKMGVEKNPTCAHEILASLPIRTYWTTNYDKLIETALHGAKKVADVKYTVNQLASTRLERDVVVYKMHGDVDNADKAVICKDDYEKYPFKMSAFSNALRGDLIEKTFLFLGFSFTDPNIDFILSRVRGMYEGCQREHYCVQKKVSRKKGEKAADFEYLKLKQDYFIRDLKRFNIQTVLVDEYDDIPVLLEKVATRYKRSSIFVSGAAEEYGSWDRADAESFLHKLSYTLSSKKNRIISGFGLGVGGAVINGVLDFLDEDGKTISDEHIVMRPFPQTASGSKPLPERWSDYRKAMVGYAGIAIFVFGNKKAPAAGVIDSNGMQEEFDLCIKAKVAPLPIGATGYMAEKLWKDVDANLAKYFPDADSQFRKQFAILGDPKKKPAELMQACLALIKALQED